MDHTQEERIYIMIVDDHWPLQLGVAAIVNSQTDMVVTAQAGTVAEALRLFSELPPDLVLMDLNLPDASGVSAIRKMISINAEARILILTTYDDHEDIERALFAGARGYLIKGMSHQLLLQAIRRISAGGASMPCVFRETLTPRNIR